MGALSQKWKLPKPAEAEAAPSAGTASTVITTVVATAIVAIVPTSTGGDYGDEAKASGAGQNGGRVAAIDMVLKEVIRVDIAKVGRDTHNERKASESRAKRFQLIRAQISHAF